MSTNTYAADYAFATGAEAKARWIDAKTTKATFKKVYAKAGDMLKSAWTQVTRFAQATLRITWTSVKFAGKCIASVPAFLLAVVNVGVQVIGFLAQGVVTIVAGAIVLVGAGIGLIGSGLGTILFSLLALLRRGASAASRKTREATGRKVWGNGKESDVWAAATPATPSAPAFTEPAEQTVTMPSTVLTGTVVTGANPGNI